MRRELTSRIMPRTTLNLDSAVLRELKARSAAEGRSLGEVASDLLTRSFQEMKKPAKHEFIWRTADLGTPLVDLYDKEAVRRA